MYLLCCASVTQSCPTLCDPVDCSPPGTSVHGDSPGKNTGVGCHDFLQKIFLLGLPNPGIKTRSPALQADYLLSESWEKPNNTAVGSLSLLLGWLLPNPEIESGSPALLVDFLSEQWMKHIKHTKKNQDFIIKVRKKSSVMFEDNKCIDSLF